jgi:hypothetical protein
MPDKTNGTVAASADEPAATAADPGTTPPSGQSEVGPADFNPNRGARWPLLRPAADRVVDGRAHVRASLGCPWRLTIKNGGSELIEARRPPRITKPHQMGLDPMQTPRWMPGVLLIGWALTNGAIVASAAQPREPQPFGLTLGSSSSQEVLAAVEQAQGAGVQVSHPPLVAGDASAGEAELERQYQGMPNPSETRIVAEELSSAGLTCKRARFLLLRDTLYGAACRLSSEDARAFTTLRDDLAGKYGPPAEGIDSKHVTSAQWDIQGKKVSLERDARGGTTVLFTDVALAARADAIRRELMANPVLLMEEMRKSGQK